MPIIKSAKKRAKQSEVRRVRNLPVKRALRDEIKALEAAIAGGKKAEIAKQLVVTQSAIDVAVKKNLIHKKRASRKMSQLHQKAKLASGAKAKTTKAKPAAKKTTVKKPAAKK